MRQGSIQLTINGASMLGTSMASSFTSDPVNLISAYAYGIQVVWSAGAATAGTFTLQGSLDAGDNGSGQAVSAPINFTNITNSPQTISGTPGSILYDVTECSYRWVRLVYTAASGSGTVTDAMMQVKGV